MHSPIDFRQASLQAQFIVIGGGIAGLAVAYVLADGGHRVRVVEKRGLGEPAGGLRVPPNLSKILRKWVGPDELKRTAVRCVGSPFLDPSDERVGYIHWKPAVMEETGGEFLMMHHEDVHRMLYDLAVGAGADVLLHTSVVAIHPGTDALPNPSVSLSNGQVLTADFLIGADGPNSRVREVVLGEDDDTEPGGTTVYVASVPGDELRKDPVLRELVRTDEWPIWMGADRSMCGHYIRATNEFNITLFMHENDPDAQVGEEGWEDVISATNLDQSQHGPSAQKLLKLASRLVRTRFLRRPEGVPDWIDQTGRIVLIGEAAHPWFPGGTHGASMAVEDAVVFGRLFSNLRSWSQVPSFLSAFQELRQARCDAVLQSDIANAKLVALPPGPYADARNADMHRQLDDWDEGALKENFEAIAEIFGYDAGDAADEWWVDWGRFGNKHDDAGPGVHLVNFDVQVVAVETE
ncbi:FAD/NAD(P)-binding domain-containing protein [Obba rivulosa]|uniref:FAD/NAD(P)-binding domain-containing protein n=1 Tax=Obba rivulosa TaxID=1052685 RepID=A0A8E2J780_9APHY|nr:FAD/NAD(P)-binding domain-containing protein [Obba rivulosa]